MSDPQFAFLIVMIGFVAIMVIMPILSLMGLMVANALVRRGLRKQPDVLKLAKNWGLVHCPGNTICVEPTWERCGASLILNIRIISQDQHQDHPITAPEVAKAIGSVVKQQTFLIALFLHICLLPKIFLKPRDVAVLPIVPFFCEIPIPNSHEKMQAIKNLTNHTFTAFASQL